MTKENETIEIKLDSKALAMFPHVEQFAGTWMMDPGRMSYLVSTIGSMNLEAHSRSIFDAPTVADYMEVRDGVAVISIEGTLMKHAMSVGQATSTVLVRKAIRQAAEDPSVKAILLSMESPGGTAAGTKEVADEIQRAKQSKPVYGHATDLMASACYWIGSQCDRLTANEMALVGSIGTYQVVRDFSTQAALSGVKVHVIKAGEFKGVGVPGTEVTAKDLAYLQDVIGKMNEQFVQAVASGRGVPVEVAKGWADGRVHIAADAKALGLIDDVVSLDDAILSARQSVEQKNSGRAKNGAAKTGSSPHILKGKSGMTKEATEHAAAVSPQDIRAACPGCSSDFVLSCLENGHTLARCQELHAESLAKSNADLTAKLEAATKENAELTAKLEAATKENAEAEASSKGVGVEAKEVKPAKGGSGSADPVAAYWEAVESRQEDEGCTRAEAMQYVNKHHAELRRAMVEAR